jgi:hypothetical protein
MALGGMSPFSGWPWPHNLYFRLTQKELGISQLHPWILVQQDFLNV